MRYLATIWTIWSEEEDPDPAESMRYREFAADAQEAGALRAIEMLDGPSSATTVRLREGQTLLTDGPFAETKEQLSGYFVLDCANLDEALALAARIPGARHGAVEVRPLLDMDAQMM
jgi:hypothetical protein